jgi:hypothetical protein
MDAPRGIWRLTEAGKTVAKKLVNKYPLLIRLPDGTSTKPLTELPDVDLFVTEGAKNWLHIYDGKEIRRLFRPRKGKCLVNQAN